MSRKDGTVVAVSAGQLGGSWLVRVTLDDAAWLRSQGLNANSKISQTTRVQVSQGDRIQLDTETLHIYSAAGDDLTSKSPLGKKEAYYQL